MIFRGNYFFIVEAMQGLFLGAFVLRQASVVLVRVCRIIQSFPGGLPYEAMAYSGLIA
jgi:hypothetical protein